MRLNYTLTRGEDQYELAIEGTFCKGCRGQSPMSYSGPTPDEPPSFECDGAIGEDGQDFDLTDAEWNEVYACLPELMAEQWDDGDYDDRDD